MKAQIFQEQTDIVLPGIMGGGGTNPQLFFVNIDNDTDLDIVIAGGYNGITVNSYRNDGPNQFTPLWNLPTNINVASMDWADYNNDTFIDFVVSGYSPGGKVTKVYRNNKNSTFTEQLSIVLEGVTGGSVRWGDYNNDGQTDLLVTGSFSSSIYMNNGDNSFTEQTNIILPAVDRSSAAWGDYDNDGLLDLIIAGLDDTDNAITEVYHNNGNNTFTRLSTANIQPVCDGSVEWGDYNNDGWLDLLITGSDYEGGNYGLVYRNNGDGSFTVQSDIILEELTMSSGTFGDYDNDGSLDILVTGLTPVDYTSQTVSRVYRNNNDNSFTEQTDIQLPQVSGGNAVWGDYNNDARIDILIAGNTGALGCVTKVFKNFTPDENTPPAAPSEIIPLVDGTSASLKWNKITGDETPSEAVTYNLRVGTKSGKGNIVATNSSASGLRYKIAFGNAQTDTTYYLRGMRWDTTYFASVQAIDNGYYGGPFSSECQFTPVTVQSTKLKGKTINPSSLLLTWNRGNGDRCIVFAKEGSGGLSDPQNNVTYYANSVYGEGSPLGSTGWFCVYKGTDDSIIIRGLEQTKSYVFHAIELQGKPGEEVYCKIINPDNHGVFSTGQFTEQSTITFSDLYANSLAWGDYNNDGFSDLIIAGYTSSGQLYTNVFRNNGDGSFSEPGPSPFPGLDGSSVAWGDYDNDEDLDLIITGRDQSENYVAKIYNNNNNTFSEVEGTIIAPVVLGSSIWADFDTDNDLDILLTGASGKYPDYKPISKIYRNDSGIFNDAGANLAGVFWGTSGVLDFNNDGLPDVLVSGISDNNGNRITKLYKNEGNCIFSEKTNFPIPGIYGSSFSSGDYNNDGFPDILVSGLGDWLTGMITRVYRNNGEGTFSEETEAVITGIYSGNALWIDYDNDGYQDIIMSGNINNVPYARIYKNNRNNSFAAIEGLSLPGSSRSMGLCDYDNDGDLDIVFSGNSFARLFKNNLITKTGGLSPNLSPAPPLHLKSTSHPEGVIIRWSTSGSDETPGETMCYNLQIGTCIGGYDIISPSSGVNGLRKIPESGNAQLDTFYIIKNLPAGKYYWQVQAVDQGYQGGAWSAVDTFEVRNVQAFYSANEVCLGYSTTFTDQSVATDGIASWYWDFKDGTTSSDQNPVHTYASSGTYPVKLVISDINGVKDSLEQNVIVKPKPLTDFSAPAVCQGIPVTATNTTNNNGLTISTWKWDFGDGGTSADQQPPPHPYLIAGDYNIKLKAVASNGCADSITHVASVGAYPVAAVTANAPLTFCKGDSVTLSVPYNSLYSYDWMVGGVSLTGGNSSSYTPKLTGSYSVKIVNLKGNCTTTSSSVAITALEAPAAPLITSGGATLFCEGDSVVLSVTNSVGYSYQWKLNSGAVGANSYQHVAKSGGAYSLTVSNSSGCSVSSANTINVTVNASPAKPAIDKSGPTTFCQGGSVDLSVTNNPAYAYQWENSGATLSGAITNSYTAQTSGVYSLKITNLNSCYTRTENVTVNVLTAPAAPLISASKSLEFCQGDSVELSVTNTLNYKYQWKNNGGAVGMNSSKYIAKNSGKYNLTVTNENNCPVNSTDTVTVTVNPAPPAGNISLSGQDTFCEGGSVTLSVPSATGNTYKWKNETGVIAGAETSSYTAVTSGNYSLEVTNTTGCPAETTPVKVTVKPSPVKPVITTSNYTPGQCLGATPVRLEAGSAVQGYRYRWIKDGEPRQNDTLTHIEFYEKGIYKLRAQVGECQVESDAVTITLPDAPEKPVVYVKGPVVWYMAAYSRTATKYQWYRNDEQIQGATRYIYVANKTLGTYKVAVGNQNECYTMSDPKTIPLAKGAMTDFYIPPEYLVGEDKEIFESLHIYPNPAEGIINVEIENDITGDLLIEIFNPEGKELYNFIFEKSTNHFLTDLNLNDQPAGYYIIKISLSERVITRIVILE